MTNIKDEEKSRKSDELLEELRIDVKEERRKKKEERKVDEEYIYVRFKYFRRSTYNLVKAILNSVYGTHYAHIGEFVSDAVDHYIQCELGLPGDANALKTMCVRENIREPKQKRKRRIFIKICEAFLEWEEDIYSPKAIRGQIRKIVEKETGLPPVRSTVYDYLNYLIDRGAFIRNQYTGQLKLSHTNLREIIKNLKGKGGVG